MITISVIRAREQTIIKSKSVTLCNNIDLSPYNLNGIVKKEKIHYSGREVWKVHQVISGVISVFIVTFALRPSGAQIIHCLSRDCKEVFGGFTLLSTHSQVIMMLIGRKKVKLECFCGFACVNSV